MLNVVIFGPPGSGKGTQSEKIIEKYGLEHISTGDLLRYEISHHTHLGALAKSYIDKGNLVPDDLIIDMIDSKIDKLHNIPGIIFDGFPRTVEQAEALKELLNSHGEEVSVMVNLNVDRQELIDRLLKRGETSGRTDDNLETIEKRLSVYESQTTPVIDYYKKEKKLVEIKGIGNIDDIFGRIANALDKIK
ncbi:MAG: adenylate kinase [Marinilabiliaceae bacterium]|nr:adenylate kinase [Marinilabiliaceae bacterium]